MSDVFLYFVDMPPGISEMVSPGWEDDYTIYVNRDLPYKEKVRAIDHAFGHLRREDFNKENVQEIETEAHRRAKQ